MTDAVRIQPLEPPYPAAVEEMLGKWMGKGVTHPPLALFRALARDLELSGRMWPLGAGLLGKASSLDPRDREIVIDRTCARCGCEYEWGVHVAIFGPRLGLGEGALIATAAGGADDSAWSPRQALLVRLVDGLHDTGRVADDLWTALRAEWSEAQCLELLVLTGWYHLISYVANGAGVPLEPWAARFPHRYKIPDGHP
jgi:4-carboxymuconolactone decarboxylase